MMKLTKSDKLDSKGNSIQNLCATHLAVGQTRVSASHLILHLLWCTFNWKVLLLCDVYQVIVSSDSLSRLLDMWVQFLASLSKYSCLRCPSKVIVYRVQVKRLHLSFDKRVEVHARWRLERWYCSYLLSWMRISGISGDDKLYIASAGTTNMRSARWW